MRFLLRRETHEYSGLGGRRQACYAGSMSSRAVVGSNVDSWCTRCKLILAHTIEAVVAGRITRVHCNTCGGQHAHRSQAPGRSDPTKPARVVRRAVVSEPDLATLLRGRDVGSARAYAPTERFAEGDLIKHGTFGVGLVTARKDVNKIEVRFSDGAKVLIHRR